ncbi:MAG: molybdopterin molybdotransferase MoeA [Deltaproteobacteria bacterium]|nr:molybdopterin molybdotransferase MoeA [Deltaproteobacteria bacterium]
MMPAPSNKTDSTYISFDEALALVAQTVAPLPPTNVTLGEAAGLVLAADASSRVDSPSVDASTKDGFAVVAADLDGCNSQTGIELKVIGTATAAAPWHGELTPGSTARITTGAPLPRGADAVVMSELCEERSADAVLVRDRPGAGRNVIARGNDVRAGEKIAAAGDPITPGLAGLLAAAGIDRIEAHALPRVALLAVGDEVVRPGTPLGDGQLYASNLSFLDAWLERLHLSRTADVIPDSAEQLSAAIERALDDGADAVITSGGAWSSHRDLVLPALEQLGWTEVFHRVRMGPGTGTSFGKLGDGHVFCLPGGPPSSAVGFLELALPGLLRLAGRRPPYLERTRARLAKPAIGRRIGWTEFSHARVNAGPKDPEVVPLQKGSRIARIARANCLLRLDEGVDRIEPGTEVDVELLGVRL